MEGRRWIVMMGREPLEVLKNGRRWYHMDASKEASSFATYREAWGALKFAKREYLKRAKRTEGHGFFDVGKEWREHAEDLYMVRVNVSEVRNLGTPKATARGPLHTP